MRYLSGIKMETSGSKQFNLQVWLSEESTSFGRYLV